MVLRPTNCKGPSIIHIFLFILVPEYVRTRAVPDSTGISNNKARQGKEIDKARQS
jgi:hypothetical protein